MKVFIVVLALTLSVALGQDVLTGLKDDLQTIGGAIKQTGKDFVPYAQTVGKDLLGTLKNDTLKMVGNTISDLLGQAISNLFHTGKRDTVTERDVLSGLKDDLQTIGGAIKETGKDFVPYAAGLGKDLLGTLKNDTLKMIGDTISDLLGQTISKLFHTGKRDTVTERDVLNGIKDDLQTIGGAIKQTGKDFVPFAAGVGKDLLGTLKNDTLKMVGGTITDLLEQAFANLFHGKRELAVLNDLLEAMDKDTVSMVGDVIAEIIGHAIENLFHTKRELTERDVLSGLKDEFQTIGGAIKQTGKDFVPFAAGIGKDLLGTLENDTLKMVGGTLTDLLGHALANLFHGKRDLSERDLLTDIKNDLQTIGGAVQQTGKDFVPFAAGIGKDLLGTLKNDTAKMVGGTLSDLLGQALANLFHGKRDLSERNLLTDIKNDLQTIGGAFKQTGKDFVPFAAGIGKDLLGTLMNDSAKMVGGTVSDLLGQALSKLFHGKRDLSERDLLTAIKNDLQTIGGAVQQTGKDFVPFAAGIGKDLLGTLKNDTAKMVGGTLSDLLGQALANLFHGKRDLSERNLLTNIKNDLQTIGGAFKQTGKDFVPFAAGIGKDLLGTLMNDSAKMVGGTVSDLLGQALSKLFHGKRDLSERDLLTDIKNDLQTIGGAVQQTGKDFVPFAAGIGKDLLGTLKNDTAKMVGGTLSDLLGQALANLFHGKRDLSERNLLTDIKNDLQTIGGAFKQTGKDFVPFAAGIGKDLLGTLMNDSAKMVGGTVSDLLGQALSKLFHGKRDLAERNLLIDIKNDLEAIGGAFIQTGKDFIPFAAGIGKDLLGTVVTDSAKIVGGTVSDVGHALSKLFHGKRDLAERNLLTDIKNDLQTIGGAFKQTGKDFVPFAAGIGKDLLGTLMNDSAKMVGGTVSDLLGQALSKLFHGKRDLAERNLLIDIKNDLEAIGGAFIQTGKDFVPFAAGIGKDLLGTVVTDSAKIVGGTVSDVGHALSKLFHGKRDLAERNLLTDIKNDLQTIGGAFKQTGKDFVPFAAGIGKDLLGTLMNDSAKMVGGTVSDLLGQALSKLFHGKRDLVERDILTDIKNDLQTIGGAVQQTGKDFVPFAAGIGKDLLGTLENDTLKMVGGTFTDLLGQALANLFHGKRDLSERDVLTGLKDDINTIGGAIKQTGKDFVPYAATVGKGLLDTLKNDTLKMVGNTITDLLGQALSKLFHFKRDTPNLVQQSQAFMSELKNLLDLGTSQFSDVIDEVFSEIQTIYTQVKSLEMHPEDAQKKIDAVAAKYRSLVTEFLQALERDVTKVVTTTFGHKKRNTVGGLGGSITGLFKPSLDAIGKMVLQPTLHPPMFEPVVQVSAIIEKYVHSIVELVRPNITQSLIAESL